VRPTHPAKIPAEVPEEATEVKEEEELEETNLKDKSTDTEGALDEPMIRMTSGRSMVKPNHFLRVTKVIQKDWNKEATDKAIRVELRAFIQTS
jgi:hypothetical protein